MRLTTDITNWADECRGLGYMILDIRKAYEDAKNLGGDSEILRDRVEKYYSYVDGPLRKKLEKR